MSHRISIVFLSVLLLSVLHIQAKEKKKQLLPEDVLRAQTVMVVIHPDAGEALTAPLANRNAQDEVERAITKWGRFDLVMDAYTADLIIAVRKGNKSGPIIAHSPADDRPVIFQPGIGDARIGQQQGRPPDLSQPLPGGMGNRGPQLGTQIISSDDTFEVYRGRMEYPLDTSPVWRYIAKDSLNAPQVPAVEQFRKAIEESEKQRQHKP
ncbi:MAG: hypothetical protein LAO18_01965 [Acidobacteriia bacterium]|nr:hypothetical protein [Terriglobia bacterium]